MFVPVTFVIINYVSYKNSLLKVKERDKQDGMGTVYYAVSLVILTTISFEIYRTPLLGLIPNLVMAYGDGFVAVFGKYIKSKNYRLRKTKKSFAGSTTMFVITESLIGIYLILNHNEVFWQTRHCLL